MNDAIHIIVLASAAAALGAAAGWSARAVVQRRRLRRRQRFFGLPAGSECVLVTGQEPGAGGRGLSRHDAYALLELSGLIRECGAHPQIAAHEEVGQGFGTRTEFCVGGPASNRRTGAHLRSMLPGVAVEGGHGGRRDATAFTVGQETYRLAEGEAEYALLARLRGPEGGRPVFLAAGQRGIAGQAAVRYLVRHQARLARAHGPDGTFCLLLKVVNSDAYGPDLVELVADVTRVAATAPPGGTGTTETAGTSETAGTTEPAEASGTEKSARKSS